MARPLKNTKPQSFAGEVGATIRRRRLKAKLSVQDAAALAQVPVPTWYHFESGVSITVERLPAIALALECTPADLVRH